MKPSRSVSGDKPEAPAPAGPSSGPLEPGGRREGSVPAAAPSAVSSAVLGASRQSGGRDAPSYNTSPRHSAANPFPRLWTAFIGFVLLTVLALALAVGEWQRPMVGMLVDPFGRVT